MSFRRRTAVASLALLGVLCVVPTARSQTPEPVGTEATMVIPLDAARPVDIEPAAGTSSSTIQVAEALSFTPHLPTTGWDTDSNWLKYCTSSPCTFFHSVQVPSGAQFVAIELEACDTDAVADMKMNLWYCHGNGCVAIPDAIGVTTSGTPGCNYFVRSITPVTVDNWNGTYVAVVSMTPSPDLKFRGTRVYTKLQVKPAPATATFGDVPTSHPFFQYVEALSQSGITAGCGGGNFCPDTPLTRGQMAVFLSKAFGLHWPN